MPIFVRVWQVFDVEFQGAGLRLNFTLRRLLLVPLPILGLAVGASVLFKPSPAAAFCFGHLPCPTPAAPLLSLQGVGYVAQDSAQVGLTGLQQHTWSTIDRIQCLLNFRDPNSPRPIFCEPRQRVAAGSNAFAEDGMTSDPVIDSAFAALGYSGTPRASRSPFVVKAQTPDPTPPAISFSAWSQGSVDDEVRTGTVAGTDIGSRNLTWAAVGGADATFMNPGSSSDAVVLGVLSGITTANAHNADGTQVRVNGPSVGAYGAYVNGGFSIDGTFKTDFLNVEDVIAGVGVPLGMYNYSTVGNVNYKQYVGSWWYQPTAGFTYTRTVWNGESKASGLSDGQDVRVQAGARFGSGFDWAGIRFTDTLTLLAYEDVLITGGTLAIAAGTPLAPTDQGKVFGQAIGNLQAQLTKNWSATIEGEVRARSGVTGLAGRLEVTYSFD